MFPEVIQPFLKVFILFFVKFFVPIVQAQLEFKPVSAAELLCYGFEGKRTVSIAIIKTQTIGMGRKLSMVF